VTRHGNTKEGTKISAQYTILYGIAKYKVDRSSRQNAVDREKKLNTIYYHTTA